MANSAYIPMSVALATNTRLEIVANNLANVDTPGYRQLRPTFRQFLVDAGERPAEKGFTALDEARVDDAPGELRTTDNPLDVALGGPGYLVVAGADGNLLTRAGSLRMQADGTLTTAAGQPVLAGDPQGETRPVVVDPAGGPITFGPAGEVEQAGTRLATLAIVDVDASRLEAVGDTTYRAAPADLRPAARPDLRQGSLEGSNVDPIRGLIALVELTQDQVRSTKIMSQLKKLDEDSLGIAG